jgi:NADH dehydrogenase/NADH:ubiquinone oxidoreductase subunit G
VKEETVQLTIDGNTVTVPSESTILDAAKEAGVEIPTLCHLDQTTSNGICRLCVVEIEGVPGMHAACVTKVSEGAVVRTRTPDIVRVRRTILEMLASTVDLSESPDICAMLESCGARPDRFAGGETRQQRIIEDNPVYIRDYSKCILCWRCVQVCAEDAQFNYAINFSGRGFHTSIGTFSNKPMPETTCVFCGQCVGVCPTGALKSKREFLFEQGLSAEEVYQQTQIQGKGKRSKGGPRLDDVIFEFETIDGAKDAES